MKIFERVNQNGTKLNNQELRHALHQGAITILLQEISDKIDILGSKNAKLRMKEWKGYGESKISFANTHSLRPF